MRKLHYIWLLLLPYSLCATDYYFDSNSGSDGNSGTSAGAPKQTLSALNTLLASAVAGDNFYLKRGSVWAGTAYISDRSGTLGNPITIEAYGSGEDPKITGFVTLGTFTSVGGNIYYTTDTRWSDSYEDYRIYSSGTSQRYRSTISDIRFNGTYGNYARFPNTGYLDMESTGTFIDDGNNTNDYDDWFTDSDITDAAGTWTGATAVINTQDWHSDLVRISSQSTMTYFALNSNDFGPSESDMGNFNYTYGWKIKYYLTDDINCLDQNLEFFHDYNNQRLYLYSTTDPNSATVEATVVDSVFMMVNCNYVNVRSIQFEGANHYVGRLNTSHNVTIDSCTLSRGGWDALFVDRCNDLVVSATILSEAKSTGAHNYEGYNQEYNNSTIHNIGLSHGQGYDRDERNGSGIMFWRYNGDINVIDCRIDSIGWCGILTIGKSSGDEGHMYYYGNFINEPLMYLTDGGGIYSFVQQNLTGQHYWRKNTIKITTANNGFFARSNQYNPLSMGLYTDHDSYDVLMDSNRIYSTHYGIYNHGSDNGMYNYNKIYKPGGIGYKDDRGAIVLMDNGYGHNGSASINNTLLGNIIVLDTASTAILWLWDGVTFDGGVNGNISGNNKLFSPFKSRTEIYGMIPNWGNLVTYTPSAWNSLTGLDATTLFNQYSRVWSVSDGFDKSNKIKFLINLTDQEVDVDLHSQNFTNELNASVSNSITLPPYGDQFLWANAGSNNDSLSAIVEIYDAEISSSPYVPTPSNDTVEFESFDVQSGGVVIYPGGETPGVNQWCTTDIGEWVGFYDVLFDNADTITMMIGIEPGWEGSMYIRLDDPTAANHDTLDMYVNTGGWESFEYRPYPIDTINGLHDVYFVQTGSGSATVLNRWSVTPFEAPEVPDTLLATDTLRVAMVNDSISGGNITYSASCDALVFQSTDNGCYIQIDNIDFGERVNHITIKAKTFYAPDWLYLHYNVPIGYIEERLYMTASNCSDTLNFIIDEVSGVHDFVMRSLYAGNQIEWVKFYYEAIPVPVVPIRRKIPLLKLKIANQKFKLGEI